MQAGSRVRIKATNVEAVVLNIWEGTLYPVELEGYADCFDIEELVAV